MVNLNIKGIIIESKIQYLNSVLIKNIDLKANKPNKRIFFVNYI